MIKSGRFQGKWGEMGWILRNSKIGEFLEVRRLLMSLGSTWMNLWWISMRKKELGRLVRSIKSLALQKRFTFKRVSLSAIVGWNIILMGMNLPKSNEKTTQNLTIPRLPTHSLRITDLYHSNKLCYPNNSLIILYLIFYIK